MDLFVQILGIVAMFFNIFSYQQKKQKNIIAMQFVGGALYAIHFFIMEAYVGALLNASTIIRAMFFMNTEKFGKKIKVIAGFFVGLYLAFYICTFTVLGKEATVFNLITEFLPIMGMSIMTIAFAFDNAAMTRKISLINSPAWLIYDAVNKSIGGVLCEVFCLVSIITGIIRLDIKKDK